MHPDMDKKGYFIAVPEKRIFEFLDCKDPDSFEGIIHWDVGAAWQALECAIGMASYASLLQSCYIRWMPEEEECFLLTPGQLDELHFHVHDYPKKKLEIHLKSAWNFGGRSKKPYYEYYQKHVDELFETHRFLMTMLDKVRPVYQPASNSYDNCYALLYFRV